MEDRADRPESYGSIRLAVLRHLEYNGTLNLEQFRRLIDGSHADAARWLGRLVADRVLREHTHGRGSFFTNYGNDDRLNGL